MNSLTSIVTVPVVFIIQSSQNRDNVATRAKLDAQNQVLGAIGQTLGVGDPQKLLELMALKEAPREGNP